MKELHMKYKIIPNLNLIIENFQGEITLEDLMNYKMKLYEDKLFNESLNYITDFRNTKFVLELEKVTKIAEFEKETLVKKDNCFTALITKTPEQVVVATLYSNMVMEESNTNTATFSSLESALSWAKIDFDYYGLINDTLIALKKA